LVVAVPAVAETPRTLETVRIEPRPAEHAQAASVLYFNRCIGGCTITKSPNDDARSRLSSIPGGASGTQYTLTAFQHGDEVWNKTMTCLREVYSPYNVTITDVQPAPGVAYNENIVAGAPSEVMYSNQAGGVSPVTGTCAPFSNVISYSFANTYDDPSDDVLAYTLCYVAAQETGHSYGMEDHSWSFISDGRSACSDPMTYRSDCLSKGQHFFRNEAATCGEFSMRPCNCGGMNSHLRLITALGVGQSIVPPPTSIITAPTGGTAQQGQPVTITAASKRGVAKVELYLNGFKWGEAKGAPFNATGQVPGPYQINFPNDVPNGVIDIVAIAKDDIGAETSSATVTVTKGAPCADASACAKGQKCEAGKCFWDPAVGELGDECTYSQYCTSGLCIAATGGEERCSTTCVPNVGDSCNEGFECIAASASQGVCWPKGADDGGGCCDAGNGAAVQSSLLGLGLILALRRRSRRARA
jgi:Bacterial Ig domain